MKHYRIIGLILFTFMYLLISNAQLTYTIANNEVTVTGYDGEISGRLDIPSHIDGYPVTMIGDSMLMFRSDLASVFMPNTIISIGHDAFYNCSNLVDVRFGTNLKLIKATAFRRCTALPTITVPTSVTSLQSDVLSGCSSLTTAFFLGDAPSAGAAVFAECSPTVYYRFGASNWGSVYAGRPTSIWPEILNMIHTQSNALLSLVASTNQKVILHTCTNLYFGSWKVDSTNYMIKVPLQISMTNSTDYLVQIYRLSIENP